MNTQETITYLLACVDAEQGIRDCEKAIDTIYQNRDKLLYKNYGSYHLAEPFTKSFPKEPKYISVEERRTTASHFVEEYQKRAKECLMLLDFKTAKQCNEQVKYNKEMLKLLENGGPKWREIQNDNLRMKQEFEAGVSEYHRELDDYNSRTDAYRETVKLMDQETIRILDEEIENYVSIKEKYIMKRDELYSMGILHERFRSQEACAQIAEYLDMGITDHLAGQDGAYYIYLDDLRTNRIVDAVNQVRNAIERASVKICSAIESAAYRLENGQRVMAYQIGNLQASFDNMSGEFKDGFNTLNETVTSSGKYFSQQFADQAKAQQEALREIGERQKSLKDIISKSAYNDYLVKRDENLGNYISYVLQDPTR
ncbi:MAG: hypothetical protein IJK00_03890 [Clostridia bacterium]|nr:hypothetical protein [Clostridia bacterium]